MKLNIVRVPLHLNKSIEIIKLLSMTISPKRRHTLLLTDPSFKRATLLSTTLFTIPQYTTLLSQLCTMKSLLKCQ